MFSTKPSTGTATLRNMFRPLRASTSAMSCGVDTITAPAQRHALRQRQLRIAGARRHVDHQHVELAPLHVAQHLFERARHHGAAPDHRRVLVDDVADRHGLETVTLDRLQRLAVDRFGLLLDVEHARHRGAVDVGIEQAGADAVGGKAERQVHRGGRLADAALARGDGDDVLHARHVDAAAAAGGLGRRSAVAVAMRVRRRRSRRCGALGGHDGRRRQHARHGAHGLFAGLAQRLQGGAAGGVDIEGDGDMAAADGDAAHHALRHDALCRRRIDDGVENLADGRFGYFSHGCLFPRPRNIVSPLDCRCCCRHIYAARPEIKADNAPGETARGPEVNDGVEQQQRRPLGRRRWRQ